MKNNVRDYIRRTVAKISKGEFDEHDISNLLIRLREYSSGEPVFTEISHFVAHAKVRDKGIIATSMDAFDLRNKHFEEYLLNNKEVDYNSPFPLWILDYIKLQADIHKDELKDDFGLTKEEFLETIKKLFTRDPKNNLAHPVKQLPAEAFYPIRSITHTYGAVPAMTGNEIIDSFKRVLQNNGFHSEARLIEPRRDSLIACILVVMHGTNYKLRKERAGVVNIASRWQRREILRPSIQANGGICLERDSLGWLNLSADVLNPESFLGHTDVKIHAMCYPVIQTHINTCDAVEPSLLSLHEPESFPDWESAKAVGEEEIVKETVKEGDDTVVILVNLEGDLTFKGGLICRMENATDTDGLQL